MVKEEGVCGGWGGRGRRQVKSPMVSRGGGSLHFHSWDGGSYKILKMNEDLSRNPHSPILK